MKLSCASIFAVLLAATGVASSNPALAAGSKDKTRTAIPTGNTSATNTGAMGSAERRQLTASIARQWSEYVRKAYGVAPADWQRSMAATFLAADPMNLRRAASRTTYEGMTATLLGQSASDAQIIGKLASLKPPVSAASLGSPANDLVYTMIAPCRIIDTRSAGGAIAGNTVRDFYVTNPGGNFSAQGGTALSDCGIPGSPSAVVMNVTVVTPTGGGYLTVFPYNTTRPTASSLNYSTGAVLGNEVIVKQTIGDTFDFSLYSFATANVVVDVSGYFMAPVATSLDCTRLSNSVNVPANNGSLVAELHCPVGYNATGGGCNNNANNQLRSFRVSASPDETDSWFECNWVNPAVTPMPADVSVRCCRTRGR